MSNPAHEALLRQGVAEWNDWRAQNGSVSPDLTGVRVPAAKLNGVDLSHARLAGATLIRTRLVGADLRYADLTDAKLHEADLTDADLFRADLSGAGLPGAKLRRARLYGANLSRAQITVADLRRADLRCANMAGTDLRESLAAEASFEDADLDRAELYRCNLCGSNLSGVRGLDQRQLELASTDEKTLLSAAVGLEGTSVASLVSAIEAMRARAVEASLPSAEVDGYHALLTRLEALGVDVGDAKLAPADMVSPKPGANRWVESALFRERSGKLLSRLRRQVSVG